MNTIKCNTNPVLLFFFFFSVFFPSEGSSSERCGNKTCQFGAKCKIEADLALKCSCDFYCDDQDTSNPVCGSDGNTYPSECILQQNGCRLQMHILITDYAPCKCKIYVLYCIYSFIFLQFFYVFMCIVYHSSEIRGLRSTKCSSETLQT